MKTTEKSAPAIPPVIPAPQIKPGLAPTPVPAANAALARFKLLCEYLEGALDEPPPGFTRWLASPLWRGLWWALLAGVILLFCGQTSKFIYIDF
jgi:hypothetical protein